MLLSPFYDMIIRFCGHKIDQAIYQCKDQHRTGGTADEQFVKERIEGGANEKAVWRLFINCPFVCINFDFFWLNKARQLYMDF